MCIPLFFLSFLILHFKMNCETVAKRVRESPANTAGNTSESARAKLLSFFCYFEERKMHVAETRQVEENSKGEKHVSYCQPHKNKIVVKRRRGKGNEGDVREREVRVLHQVVKYRRWLCCIVFCVGVWCGCGCGCVPVKDICHGLFRKHARRKGRSRREGRSEKEK